MKKDFTENQGKTFFAPQLYISSGTTDVSFYAKAFDAKEIRRITNENDSIHVVEFEVDGTLFHLHEQTAGSMMFSPKQLNGTTVKIGLFVRDVDAIVHKAIQAGASQLSAPRDYDYGYRQAEILDPFGHCWLIEKKL